MIKRIKSLFDLSDSIDEKIDAIIVNEKSEVFDDIIIGIKELEKFNHKYPNTEIRITRDLDGADNDFKKLVIIKNKLLKNNTLNNSSKVRIQLPGMKAFNNYSNRLLGNNISTSKIFHSMEEIFKSEKIINELTTDIKKYNFSPLESALAAYIKVINYKDYKEADVNELSKSRSLYAVLLNDYIVCEGYVRFYNRLLNELGISSSELMFTNSHGAHAVSLSNIVDTKYDVSGKYIFDPTFDNYMKRNSNQNINIFLPTSYFGLSYSDFETIHKGTTINKLKYVNCGDEELPSIDSNSNICNEVSQNKIDEEILKNCFINVYKKMFNDDFDDNQDFDDSFDYFIKKRKNNNKKLILD